MSFQTKCMLNVPVCFHFFLKLLEIVGATLASMRQVPVFQCMKVDQL